MIQYPMGSDLIFVVDLNVDLERTGGLAVATVGIEDISTHYFLQWREWN